jgi:hypothetical protein
MRVLAAEYSGARLYVEHTTRHTMFVHSMKELPDTGISARFCGSIENSGFRGRRCGSARYR